MRIDLRVAGVSALVLLFAAPMIVAPAQAQEYSSGKIPITTSSDEARQLYLDEIEKFWIQIVELPQS